MQLEEVVDTEMVSKWILVIPLSRYKNISHLIEI